MIEDMDLLAFGPSDWGERRLARLIDRQCRSSALAHDTSEPLNAIQRAYVVFPCRVRHKELDGGSFKGCIFMADLSKMKNLRAGPIYAAAMVAPTTVRTWGVELGVSEGTGHPRYDVTDVVAVMLMRQLTSKNMILAASAAIIVNALRRTIAAEVEAIAARQQIEGRWRWDGGNFAIVKHLPEGGAKTDNWLSLVSADRIGDALCDRTSGQAATVISLQRCINSAILALENELSRRQVGGTDE